jgi:hypothetical protein
MQRSSHLPTHTGYIPYKISSPALPYRTSSCAYSGQSFLFPSRVTQILPKSRAFLAGWHCEPSGRDLYSLGVSCAATHGMQTLFSHFVFTLFARACANSFTLTTHHRPPSTASGTPFRQSACQTRGAPRSRRPSRCASRRKASTKRSQPSSLLGSIFSLYFSTHVEVRQVRAAVGAHFLGVHDVASVLCVRSHGAGTVSLVVVFAGLLGVERQAAD